MGTIDENAFPDYGMKKYTRTDGPKILEAADDPATANVGSKWHSPTTAEIKEILDNTKCEWTFTVKNGVNGYSITSKVEGFAGNSIFLPLAGSRFNTDRNYEGTHGFYWSSTLDSYTPYFAYVINLNSYSHIMSGDYRNAGLSVRAVTK